MDIKRVIKSKGWTLAGVGSQMKRPNGEIGIPQASVSQIINGNPTLAKLQEIASIIGISVSELLSDEDDLGNHGTLIIDGNQYDVILKKR